MQGTAAAKGHVGKLARVVTAFDRHHADGPSHFGVGHGQDGFGRCQDIQAQRACHMGLYGLLSRFRVQGLQQTTAQRTVCRNATKHHIGIRHGGAGVATAVAHGPWNAAC